MVKLNLATLFIFFWPVATLARVIDITSIQTSAEKNHPQTKLEMQPAETCIPCHASIYSEWKESFMANAWSNPVFQLEFSRFQAFQKKNNPEFDSRSNCMRCHAPVAVITGDLELNNKQSKEGVTCDVCHRVADARINQSSNYALVVDPRTSIKYGKIIAKNDFHTTQSNLASLQSRLCAGCHVDIAADNDTLERTYLEWKASNYAEKGIQCIHCHMPKINTKKGDAHLSHHFMGGHANSGLTKGAVKLEINVDANTNSLVVFVNNVSIGHNFPTGGAHPSQAILTVEVSDASKKIVYADKRIFSYGTQASPDLTNANDMFVDTTIKPLEKRKEIFKVPFKISEHQIKAKLVYQLLPDWYAKDIQKAFFDKYYKPFVIDEVKINP